jgi:hypothetical protein
LNYFSIKTFIIIILIKKKQSNFVFSMLISLALENNIIGRYTNFNDFLVVQKHIFAPPRWFKSKMFRYGVASATFAPPSLRY